MNVLFFLKERTRFIRYVFDNASAPFSDTKRKIEDHEPPFGPAYSDDGEPPYFEEWILAEEGLQSVGRMCISMLSATLKLYLKGWEDELHLKWESEAERKSYFKDGFVSGYRRAFGEGLNISWSDCPADFDVLEQIVLARHRDQHPENITIVGVSHRYAELARFRYPIFLSEGDSNWLATDPDTAALGWSTPNVHVSREAFETAIGEVEKLANWLEGRMVAAKYSPRD